MESFYWEVNSLGSVTDSREKKMNFETFMWAIA